MTRWDALTTTCDYLRAGLLGGERPSEREITWELVIEVASFHYVTPALATCLDQNPNVPADVRAYFDSIAALNGQRNEKMLAGVERVAKLLNAIDIEPVLLKGMSLLAEELYRDPVLRFLGDADILIPASRAVEAEAILRTAGFDTKPGDVVPPPSHHHLPVLHDPETGLGVELHTDVMTRSHGAAIETAWFCERSRSALFRNRRVRLPEPTRNAGHIIFHAEVFHGLYSLNKIQLRYLLDLAVLRARHEDAVDWHELDQRFSAAGLGEVLATYLLFNEALLGQAAPKLRHAARPDALAQLREAEARDSFHSQIERLKDSNDTLQTELSHMTAARDRFQSQAERAATELVRAGAARNDLATMLKRVTATRDELAAAVVKMTTERDDLAAAIVRMANDRNDLAAAVARTTGERNDLAASAVRTTIERADFAVTVAQRTAERDRVAAELRTALHASVALQSHISLLQRSRSWRLTAPLRFLVGTFRRWFGLSGG